MKDIVIFSGTTEGRILAESFAVAGIPVSVCVASDYGREVMEENPLIEVQVGRLDAAQIEELLREKRADLVFDATHPYAQQATLNISRAAKACGVEYRRIEREVGSSESGFQVTYAKSSSEAADLLEETQGNILLTTGSKELHCFSRLSKRIYARVLPSHEAIELCEQAGLEKSHIIAAQGPFTYEEDLALLRRHGIATLVTKASGKNGGYDEKLRAAREAGVSVITIERGSLAGPEKKPLQLYVIGAGCGEDTLTREACRYLRRAKLILGPKRLLGYPLVKASPAAKVACYKPADIIAAVEEAGCGEAAVLFSGDVGFYSGAKGLLSALPPDWKVKVCPGVSSVQALSAALGFSYENAAIVSFHGREVDKDMARSAVEGHELSFFLVSAKEDAAEVLAAVGRPEVASYVGVDLGSERERVVEVGDSGELPDGSLYVIAVKRL